MDLRVPLSCMIIGLGVWSTVFCQLDYESCRFLLKAPKARSHVKHGDYLTYMFSITLNLSTPADNMSIFVNGTDLQVLSHTDLLGTNFTWMAADGRIAEMSSPVMNVEVFQESEIHPVSEIDLAVPLTFEELQLRNMSGQMELHVTDAAALGGILRPIMYISLLTGQNPVYQTRIFGDYVFMEMPDMKMSSAVPRDLDIKETATIMTYLRIPAMPLKPSMLNVYIPKTEAASLNADDPYTEEPYLTVKDFQCVGVTGLSMESSQQIGDTNPAFLSNSRTSEIDGIVFAIPGLSYNDTISTNSSYQLDFLMKIESLEFTGSHDGMEQKVVSVLEMGHHFFLIRNSTLLINRTFDVGRIPKLNFTLELLDTETSNARSIVQYQFRVWHAGNVSMSSAYNMSILLFFPPFLHGLEILRTKDVIRTNAPVENTINENFIEFKIQRVSFIHNVRIQFSLILNTSHQMYKPDEQFMTIVETWYTDWRDRQYIRDSEAFQNVFNITASKESTKVKPLCECFSDRFAQCRRSTESSCDGKIDVTCVDCSFPWRCVRTLEGYGRASSLKVGSNVSLVCGTTKRNRKSRSIGTCTKQYTNGTITRLSPVVGTILGWATDRNKLYGVSQNGLAYMMSKDEGTTWYNIHPQMYARVLKTSTFESANFEQY